MIFIGKAVTFLGQKKGITKENPIEADNHLDALLKFLKNLQIEIKTITVYGFTIETVNIGEYGVDIDAVVDKATNDFYLSTFRYNTLKYSISIVEKYLIR